MRSVSAAASARIWDGGRRVDRSRRAGGGRRGGRGRRLGIGVRGEVGLVHDGFSGGMSRARSNAGARGTVGPEVDETDFTERRLADDIQRAAVLATIDDDLLAFLDELELLDARADRGLPGKTVLRTDHHFAGGRRVARHDARSRPVALARCESHRCVPRPTADRARTGSAAPATGSRVRPGRGSRDNASRRFAWECRCRQPCEIAAGPRAEPLPPPLRVGTRRWR